MENERPEFKKPVFIDCDDTLVLWDVSKYEKTATPICSEFFPPEHITLVPHQKNINLLKKFAKLGYDVIVWSQTGSDWAREVVNILGLEKYVTAYAAKPNFYLDDLPCTAWMGTQVWRDPLKEESE